MIDSTPWTQREFGFDVPLDRFPYLLERLRGTPARLEDRLRDLPAARLTARPAEGWSVQAHAGHLISVEALWDGRLDDFDEGLETLRPADMSNAATAAARYDDRPIEEILEAFRAVRGNLIARLEGLDEARIARVAFHPRLQRPMRVLDMMVFIAEHDDQHLVRITELLRDG